MEQSKFVKYSRFVKRISLQRYLASKLCYEKSKVSEIDLIVLYDNQLWLELKSSSDPDFHRKFGRSLEVLSSSLKEVNLSRGLTTKALNSLSNKIQTKMSDFLVPNRNYKDFKKRVAGSFSVLALQKPQIANRHIPEPRRIGTGYRDKGTRRNPAKDGSPSWQEVASQAGQLTLATRRINEAKNIKDIERVFKDLGLT